MLLAKDEHTYVCARPCVTFISSDCISLAGAAYVCRASYVDSSRVCILVTCMCAYVFPCCTYVYIC